MFVSLLPGIEWLVRTLIRTGGSVPLSTGNVTTRILFARLNPALSAFERLERAFGVDVRSTWALAFIRKRTIPIAGCLCVAGWLSTSLVVIDTFQAGLQERFGAPVSNRALEPGFHIKAPWPIDTVQRVETSRVRTLTLGFSGPREGASLLWTKKHAQEEYNLLLGDGRDLVTVNALLHYNVSDPWLFHYTGQNPEEMLRLAAEQAILHNTVNRSLDHVLSENTSIIAAQIEDEIRQRARDYQIGVEILDLSLQGLHPPIEVARDYQAVVSAQHEREISILEARSYEIQKLHTARALALQITQSASADAVGLVTRSHGEASAFETQQIAYSEAPDPFEQRRKLAALKQILSDQTFIVLDAAIEQDGGVFWFEDTP
ncbi:MAG: protease modulator HflK [Pseudomonadota bacterium]